MNIKVSGEILNVCECFVGAAVEARCQNSLFCQPLWEEIDEKCGKDPSRYRPSAEALIRRVLQGKPLYQKNTFVDLINLASIAYGYSIGGFDADKFVGDTLTLGVGKAGEPYEGIGRCVLNIEGLPVYRDELGGVAFWSMAMTATKPM